MSRLPAFLLVVALALLPGCASQPEIGAAEEPQAEGSGQVEGVNQVEPPLIEDLEAARRYLAEVNEIRAEAQAIVSGYLELMDDEENAFTESWTEAAEEYRERTRVLAAKARSVHHPGPLLFDDVHSALGTLASALEIAERSMAEGLSEQDLAGMFDARGDLKMVRSALVVVDVYLDEIFKKAPELQETATPEPTSAVPASSTYVDDVLRLSEEMSTTFSLFTALGKVPDILSDAWIQDVRYLLNRLREHAADARALEPPPKYAEVHELLLKAMDEYEAFADTYEAGVEQLDPDLLDEALEHLLAGNGYMEQATQQANLVESQ